MSARTLLLALAAVAMAALAHAASEPGRRYAMGEQVPLLAAKIGPFASPSESYSYYSLPFCQPEGGLQYAPQSLAQALEGNRLAPTAYNIQFRTDVEKQVLCKRKLSASDMQAFRTAVHRDFYFQLYMDDLPLWGFIGTMTRHFKTSSTSAYEDEDAPSLVGAVWQLNYQIFTYLQFDLRYNDDQVIEVNVMGDRSQSFNATTAQEDQEVEFSYSVRWQRTTATYAHRMDRYSRYSFLPQHLEIHWFSIVNSCFTLLLTLAFVINVVRSALKNEWNTWGRCWGRCWKAKGDNGGTGWKGWNLHGDVFRPPAHANLLAAMLGVGTQMLAVALLLFAVVPLGVLGRGNLGPVLSSALVLHALTGGVAGYVGGLCYKMMGGTNWTANVLLCAGLFSAPLLGVFACLNTVAVVYQSTAALPPATIAAIVAAWVFVALPLTVLGGYLAKGSTVDVAPPCRVNKTHREIPSQPWHSNSTSQWLLAGIVTFSVMYVELYYIFASVWGHKVYVIAGVLLVIFALVVTQTALLDAALTCMQFAYEDHRWWWRSYVRGGASGVVLLAYCFYYYFARSDMSGLLQTSFFFGYSALLCYAVFLALGSVGFWASHSFVQYAYRRRPQSEADLEQSSEQSGLLGDAKPQQEGALHGACA